MFCDQEWNLKIELISMPTWLQLIIASVFTQQSVMFGHEYLISAQIEATCSYMYLYYILYR